MIAYANNPALSGVCQSRSSESVQAQAVDEYRTALRGAFRAVPHGNRTPRLIALDKHIGAGENKVADTTVAMAFGSLRLGADIEAVTLPFRVITGMLRAQVPIPNYSDAELHRMETEIEGELNNLQLQYMSGDRSLATKRKMLEKFERIYEIVGQLIAQLRKDLYGGPRR